MKRPSRITRTSDQKPPAPEIFELELEAMANGGSAMGWHEQRAVFVPYTIPGERIVAQVTDGKGRFARAEGVRLLEASADRVFPACPHFGQNKCWRCHWQHIDYAAQLLLKQDVLADQLARIAGLRDLDIRPVIASPDQWHYNYHMTFYPTGDEEGASFGFPRMDDNGIEPISDCHVLHPDLLALYESLEMNFTNVRSMKLQIGTDGAHMIILTLSTEDAPELMTDLATSVNIILPDNEPVNLIGDSHTRYEIDGHHFRVTAGSSFRANIAQLPALASTVMQYLDLQPTDRVLDLYAGVGFFSVYAAAQASLVTLVESYPPAVTDADENLAAYDNVDVIEGGVEDVLESLEERYDAAIIDPGAEGITNETAALLAESGISRLVYVSGDAAMLAHDCKRLAQVGFTCTLAQPIDLSPQTYHIDAVVRFERSNIDIF